MSFLISSLDICTVHVDCRLCRTPCLDTEWIVKRNTDLCVFYRLRLVENSKCTFTEDCCIYFSVSTAKRKTRIRTHFFVKSHAAIMDFYFFVSGLNDMSMDFADLDTDWLSVLLKLFLIQVWKREWFARMCRTRGVFAVGAVFLTSTRTIGIQTDESPRGEIREVKNL